MARFQFVPGEALREIGQRLAAAGYTERSLAVALGRDRVGHLPAADRPLHLLRFGEGPLATLARCFLLGLPVSRGELAVLLGEPGVDALIALGWLEMSDDELSATIRIATVDHLLIAHDPEDHGPLAADHVTGVGPAPRTLLALTMRDPVESALDIGTGCGVQALMLADHASRVVATDVNPRALWLARCNAALNGIDTIDFREGSLFDPVAGERFDLIVANPPFVQSPDSTWIFRDAGTDRNICEELIANTPDHLQEGGHLQALVSWGIDAGGDDEAEPRRWVAGTGCDAWLLHHRNEDGLSYAATWNTWLRDRDPAAYAATLDRWRVHFSARGIEQLAVGAIMLRRRRSGTPWWRADKMMFAPVGQGGGQVRRVIAAQDRLGELSDDAMRSLVFRFAGPHQLDQRMRWREGAYGVELTRIALDDSAGVVCDVDPQALAGVFGIDGERTVSEIMAEVTDGFDEEECGRTSRATCATFRELFAKGVVELVN